MEVRQVKYQVIESKLAYLQTKVNLSNSLNLTDINIHAENFFRDLFNNLGYSFTNANFDAQNAAAIDLIDREGKVAIQVTSQNDNTKIKNTIDGFYAKKENEDIKLKVLLIAKDAKSYTTAFGHNFDHAQDVLDMKRLLSIIQNKTTDEIISIADFLDREVVWERRKTESTEVETIMALIDYLSKDENRAVTERNGDVDPEYKIYNRFADHANFLTEQYGELYVVYNGALQESRRNMDGLKAIIISSYLKEESDRLLTKNNNNPKEALHEFTNYFYERLSSNGFINFDRQAIRFYLLDEMIKCNVFPN